MNKSELIERIVDRQEQLSVRDVELAVKTMLEHMTQVLSSGERIEIRGFGSFSVNYRAPRVGRNPKTAKPLSYKASMCRTLSPAKSCAIE